MSGSSRGTKRPWASTKDLRRESPVMTSSGAAAILSDVVFVAVVDLCANRISDGAVGDEVGAMGPRFVHTGIVHGQFNQFLNLAGDAPPFGQSDIAGLGLVGVAFPIRAYRDDVLALLHRAMDGGVEHAMPLVHQHLAERRLIVAFVGPSQPVFDCSLDHATLPASSA